jgi:hypothetical protein
MGQFSRACAPGHPTDHGGAREQAGGPGVRYNEAMKRVAPGPLASASAPLVAALVLVLAPASAFAQAEEPPPPLPPPTPPLVNRQAEPPPAPAAPAPVTTAPPPAPAAAPPVAPARPAEAPPREARPAHRPVPPPRTGFSMAVRTGLGIPMGKVASGSPMYDTFSPQVPLVLDLGGKPDPHLFIGAYLGLAVGGVNGRLSDLCDRTNADCASASFWIGLEAQYLFAPAKKINPWIGYGLGLEGGGVGNTVRNSTTTTTFTGFDFARFSGGFDVRISRVVGIGPLLDLNLGRYSHTTTKIENTTLTDQDIGDKRVHAWLTIGARLVIFP